MEERRERILSLYMCLFQYSVKNLSDIFFSDIMPLRGVRVSIIFSYLESPAYMDDMTFLISFTLLIPRIFPSVISVIFMQSQRSFKKQVLVDFGTQVFW